MDNQEQDNNEKIYRNINYSFATYVFTLGNKAGRVLKYVTPKIHIYRWVSLKVEAKNIQYSKSFLAIQW